MVVAAAVGAVVEYACVMVTYACDEEVGRKDLEEEEDEGREVLRGGEGGSAESGLDLISCGCTCFCWTIFWLAREGETHSREDRGSGSSLCSTCGCDFADVDDLFFGSGGTGGTVSRGAGSSKGTSGWGLVEPDDRFLGVGTPTPGSGSGLRIFL